MQEPDAPPLHQIRARHDATTIRVYQAYSDAIANAALEHGTLAVPPFKMDRMTWIKPSFLWMMYRAGWGFKDDGQTRILAIDITRAGFEWALDHACLSHADPILGKAAWEAQKQAAPVRIQWDPERDLLAQPLAHRAIQIGLSKQAVGLYVNEWTTHIEDVTPLAHAIHALVVAGNLTEAATMLPVETPYPATFPRR